MLVKCPKCELNYMEDTDKLCRVCFREIHGNEPVEEQELCTICNEAPVVPGKVFCHVCLREMNGEKVTVVESDEDEPLMAGDGTVSSMDEIVPDINDKDIPEPEYQEIDKNLSLEEMEEQEESENSSDEDEDD